MKKQPVKLQKDEFRALLLRHVEEDVVKAFDGGLTEISMFLRPDEVAFVEQLGKETGGGQNTVVKKA
jgi:hypothetical protein